MKTTTTDKVIVGLTIIILAIAAILYSMQPNEQAGAVEYTAGTPATTVHINPVKPVKPIVWAETPAYFIPQYHNSPRAEFQCESPYFINGRVVNSVSQMGERFAGCEAVAEVKRDTDDTHMPVIVDVPATPEQPEIVPPTVEPPIVEPEQPEQPETPEQPEIPSNPETPEEPAEPEQKNKCNKGSGNGAEGCDPGNHPENGNNDEGGNRHPENSNGGGNSH